MRPGRWTLLLLAATACRTHDAPRSAASATFPDAFTAETDLADDEGVRVEGQTPAYSASHGALYFTKWFLKKLGAPAEELAYFDAQRELYARMVVAAEAAPQGAARARLALVGDVMWLGDHWDTFLGDDVRRVLAAGDGVLGNLETPVATALGVPSGLPDYIAYNSAPGLVRSFRDGVTGKSLFLALSVANNHAFDRRDEGARATLDFLDAEHIPRSGLRPSDATPRHAVLEVGGLRLGYAATTWGFNNPVAAADSKLAPSWLPGLAPEEINATDADVDLADVSAALEGMARDRVDFKIVSVHWGHEFEAYPTPVQMKLARKLVALGADLVVGAHPHVHQPTEICFVNGAESALPEAQRGLRAAGLDGCRVATPDGRPRRAFVVYSLGNFATNMWSFLCELGLIAKVELWKDAQGNTEWRPRGHAFVHNLRASRTGERRLEMLSTYVDGRCDADACPEHVRAFAEFAERHLTGAHLDAAERARLRDLARREAAGIIDRELYPAASSAIDAVPTAAMLREIRATLP